MPETKDRTLEEIDEMFEKKVGAWKFKSYVCVEANDARLAGFVKEEPGEEKLATQQLEFTGK